MRFIIHEQPYERPIVAGLLRYERDGQPTGAVEQYRVTAAVDGYRFLRVDLDARAAPSGRSTLYHMTLNPAGKPEQLKVRFWAGGLEISGTVLWDSAQMTATREVNGVTFEDENPMAAFWFPSGAGLSLLAPLVGGLQPVDAVTLNQDSADPALALALQRETVTVRALPVEQLDVMGHMYQAEGFDITWDKQRRQVWLHEDSWPLRVWRDDGLTAVATQLVIYR